MVLRPDVMELRVDITNTLAPPARVLMSVHANVGDDGATLVGRRDPTLHTLELYDPMKGRHPLFVHILPANTVEVAVARRLLFVLYGTHKDGYRLAVLARNHTAQVGSKLRSSQGVSAALVLQVHNQMVEIC